MKKLAGKIAAIPFKIAGTAMGLVPVGSPTVCWKWAYRLSGDHHDAAKYLSYLFKEAGIEAVRAEMDRVLQKCRHCEVSSLAAMMELHCGNFQAAEEIVERAKGQWYAGPEMLLQVEFYLSRRDQSKNRQVVEQILARNDLPMEFTRLATVYKMWSLAEERKMTEAGQIADRVLAIEELGDARLIKWIQAQAAGNQTEADMHLELARQKYNSSSFNVLVAQGWLIMGDKDKAMEHLSLAEKEGLNVKDADDELGQLARSEEYRLQYGGGVWT